MIKLSNILKEVLEGAKVTFDNDKVSSIKIAYSHLDGEQLNTDSGVTKKNSYQVFYSLSSDPKATNIKAAQDALKYDSNKIKPAELQGLLKSTLLTRLPKVDYIGLLESKGGLNSLLIDTLKKLYTGAEVIAIEKMEYKVIDNAVDWVKFAKQTDTIKNDIIDFLYKTAKEAPPYKIRKSDKLQSMLVKMLHSKYNIGLHPSGEGERFPPVYNAIVECLTKGKTMLLVDDNIHTGTDFYKIFKGIETIKDRLIQANSKPAESEERAIKDLEELKKHPKLKSSEFLQKKMLELEREVSMYRLRVSTLNNSILRSRDHFYGYAFYLLQDSDLKR